MFTRLLRSHFRFRIRTLRIQVVFLPSGCGVQFPGTPVTRTGSCLTRSAPLWMTASPWWCSTTSPRNLPPEVRTDWTRWHKRRGGRRRTPTGPWLCRRGPWPAAWNSASRSLSCIRAPNARVPRKVAGSWTTRRPQPGQGWPPPIERIACRRRPFRCGRRCGLCRGP